MKFVLITREEAVAEAARQAFPPSDELLVFGEWSAALDASEGTDLLFVDQLATLDEPHKIAGYERFAEAKMAHGIAHSVPTVLIALPKDYVIDSIVGYPDFLFAHYPRPVTHKLFRHASALI